MAYRGPYRFPLGFAELGTMKGYVCKLQIVGFGLALLCAADAAPRYIGMVSADGSFWVDSAGVSGHATVFEGSTVETTDSSATVQIGSTVRVVLDASSRAQVFVDHLVLERGRGQLDSGSNYRLEARTLRVMAGSAGSRAVVAIGDAGVVEVESIEGNIRVANADGVRVANVGVGSPVALGLERGGGPSILSGCVARDGKAYVVRDEVSAVSVELQGMEMGAQTGKRVQVTGKVVPLGSVAAHADQVLQAAQVRVLEGDCGPTTGPAGRGSRARVAPGAAGSPRALIAGVRVQPASDKGAEAVTSRGDDKPDKPHKPPNPHRPPISPGR